MMGFDVVSLIGSRLETSEAAPWFSCARHDSEHTKRSSNCVPPASGCLVRRWAAGAAKSRRLWRADRRRRHCRGCRRRSARQHAAEELGTVGVNQVRVMSDAALELVAIEGKVPEHEELRIDRRERLPMTGASRRRLRLRRELKR